jgi:hypothetical protein
MGSGTPGSTSFQSLTAKTSYDSLDSISFQSGQSGTSSPWSSSGISQFSATLGTVPTSQSRTSSRTHGSNSIRDPFSDSFSFNFDKSSTSILDLQVNENQRIAEARSAFNNAAMQSDKSYLELMVKNLQKSIVEKDNTIDDLKTRLDAIITAIAWDTNAQADRAITSALESMNVDALEIAHRIVSRIKLLKEENDSLGVSASPRPPQFNLPLG